MDAWTEIRRKVLVDGVSKGSVLRDYGIGHQALAKILANPERPGYQMSEVRRKPVLGPFLGVIDEILAADREAPPKQRHTAKRIFERLGTEFGYTGCYSQVQTAVASAKRYSKEVFVLWVPRRSSAAVIRTFRATVPTARMPPWCSRSSAWRSSAWSSSSASRGAPRTIWRSRSSCCATRWRCCAARSTDLLCGQ